MYENPILTTERKVTHDEADRIYISKYFIISPLNKSKEKSIRYENLFILHDLIEFYKPYNT